MPIFAISWAVTALASFLSNRCQGPRPLTGSRPMKKFRMIDISGTVARSW